MSDIAFNYDPSTDSGVIDVTASDFVLDDGLETAVSISLLTDRRAYPEDVLPQPDNSLRGWFAGNDWGSRIWLLETEPITPLTLSRMEAYAKEALQWMIDDGVASDIVAIATRVGLYGVSLNISISKPPNNSRTFRFFYNWEAERTRTV